MQKKAESYKEYGEAAITEMIVNKLPEIAESVAKAIAEPMSKIGNITVIDSGAGGTGSGASKVANYAADLLTKVPEMVKATTGIDMVKMLGNIAKNIGDGDTKTEE